MSCIKVVVDDCLMSSEVDVSTVKWLSRCLDPRKKTPVIILWFVIRDSRPGIWIVMIFVLFVSQKKTTFVLPLYVRPKRAKLYWFHECLKNWYRMLYHVIGDFVIKWYWVTASHRRTLCTLIMNSPCIDTSLRIFLWFVVLISYCIEIVLKSSLSFCDYDFLIDCTDCLRKSGSKDQILCTDL